MTYQAIYRVWRPQRFADVVGQEHVTTTLKNALSQEQITHAYLFSGPRGTGKTSAAKIFAKAVNCEKSPVSEPCNECPTCLGITDGSITDVIEIDAASNNGVDEIRDIRDNVKFTPTTAKYKVYIIDEVHMLTTGAYNALLKTLEEPPAHVIFILATTEPHKIPLTVISRCQRFDFKRITTEVIVARMEEILSELEIAYDSEALLAIAKAAEGGMRDALSLLDQVISFGSNEVTIEDALTITGTVSQDILNELAKLLNEKDLAPVLNNFEKLLLEGKDPSRFIEEFIFYYRDMLLYKTAPNLDEASARVELDEEFKQLAEAMDIESIYLFIETLNKTQQEIKYTNHPRVFIEVMFVKLCNNVLKDDSALQSEVNQLQERIIKLEEQLANPQFLAETKQVEKPQQVQRTRSRNQANTFEPAIRQINEVLNNATREDLTKAKSNWGQMINEFNSRNMRADTALLMEAEPVAASPSGLVIKFKYDVHCGMAMTNTNLISNLVNFYSNIYGGPIEINGVTDSQWPQIRANFLKSNQASSSDNEGKEAGGAGAEAQVEAEEPLVAEAKKLFGENLIEIKN